mgnify:FL=1
MPGWGYREIPRIILTEKQKSLCDRHGFDFSGLSALFLNCTLKPSGRLSHTERLLDVSKAIMEANGVAVEMLRPVDCDLPPGVYPDMREHGFAHNDWPDISRKVMAANILVVGTPI